MRIAATKLGYLVPSVILTMAGLTMYFMPQHGLQLAGWGETFSYGVTSFVAISAAILVGTYSSKRKITAMANPQAGFTRQLAAGSL